MFKTLPEWELEKGVEVKTPNRNKIIQINETRFKKLLKNNYIVTKTEKGLKYLEENKIIGGRI